MVENAEGGYETPDEYERISQSMNGNSQKRDGIKSKDNIHDDRFNNVTLANHPVITRDTNDETNADFTANATKNMISGKRNVSTKLFEYLQCIRLGC